MGEVLSPQLEMVLAPNLLPPLPPVPAQRMILWVRLVTVHPMCFAHFHFSPGKLLGLGLGVIGKATNTAGEATSLTY